MTVGDTPRRDAEMLSRRGFLCYMVKCKYAKKHIFGDLRLKNIETKNILPAKVSLIATKM